MKPLERAVILRDAINAIKATRTPLLEAELYGAADEVDRSVVTLEKQWETFVLDESVLVK